MFGSRTKTHSQFERVADKVYTWRSADQNFFYYDKEKQQRVALPKDAQLIPLTATNSITGVRERDHGRATQRFNNVLSNEFVDYKNEMIRVREFDKLDNTKTVLFEGVYSPTIRDAISGIAWCKFTKNIYCLLEGEVVRLSLNGASLTSWIEFEDSLKKDRVYLTDGHYITLGEAVQHRHGSVDYFAPTFTLGDISSEANAIADEVAAEVEDKLAKNRAAFADMGTEALTTDTSASSTTSVQSASTSTSVQEASSESIDLSEIPF